MNEHEWNDFILPYELAMEGFMLKLESMRKQYDSKGMYNPIEIITGRIKTYRSTIEKAQHLGINIEDIKDRVDDIAGIRVICKYISDVYKVYDLLVARKDLTILTVKDYIKEPKDSGYQSLHIIALYHVETIEGSKPIRIEFQIRTHAMHLWASIEHELKYKYKRNVPVSVAEKLLEASKVSQELDKEMLKIRDAVEAQEELEDLEAPQGSHDYGLSPLVH